MITIDETKKIEIDNEKKETNDEANKTSGKQKLLDLGLTEEEINELAYHVKSIIDAGTGNFKAIKNRKLKIALSFNIYIVSL